MGRNRICAWASPVSLALQDQLIRQRFPGFQCKQMYGEAIWIGHLQPREFSTIYRVEVRYKLSGCPRVKVLDPSLAPGSPHRYADGTLCLFWPKEWVWCKQSLIAKTIIPWTALWLLYYELWMDIGEWLGPSSHAQPFQQKG
jgi:hypothetical protein